MVQKPGVQVRDSSRRSCGEWIGVNGSRRQPRVLMLIDTLRVTGPARLVVTAATGLRHRGVDARVAHLGIGDSSMLESELHASQVPVLNLEIGRLLHPRPVVQLARYLMRE